MVRSRFGHRLLLFSIIMNFRYTQVSSGAFDIATSLQQDTTDSGLLFNPEGLKGLPILELRILVLRTLHCSWICHRRFAAITYHDMHLPTRHPSSGKTTYMSTLYSPSHINLLRLVTAIDSAGHPEFRSW